jgi:predicted GNAT family acetyltransferase
MKVSLARDAGAFLDRTSFFRSQEPYLTHVMGTVATSVAKGQRTYEKMSWWVVEDSDAAVCGMMMRTAPHKLVLSPMPREAIDPAVAAVVESDREIPGLSGSKELVESFLVQFIKLSNRAVQPRIEHRLLVYVLDSLNPPSPSTGSLRPGQLSEFELLLTWWTGFAHHTNVERHGLEEGLRASLVSGRIHRWMINDRPVCAVANSSVVNVSSGPVARIGPVYTPPEERRKGYAGQLTAAVSSHLIQRGIGLMLFTDATNATSNGVYARLGYERVDEMVECVLEPCSEVTVRPPKWPATRSLEASNQPAGRYRRSEVGGGFEGQTIGGGRAADVVTLGQVATEVAE